MKNKLFQLGDSLLRILDSSGDLVLVAIETMYSDGYVVRVQDVQKNNGLVLCGLTIQKVGVNIAPTIYLKH